MTTYRFDPDMTFREVSRLLGELNDPAHRDSIAKLTWLEGSAKDETLTYLYDPLAERFGHRIDKDPLSGEVVSNLINGISVEVALAPSHEHDHAQHEDAGR